LLGLVASAAVAHARPAPPEPIAFEVTAPDECPASDAMFAAIRSRANTVRVAKAERTFRIAIDRDGWRGTLDIVEGDGTSTTRDVSGATCAEAVDALVLVAALAIEDRQESVAARPRVQPAPAEPWRASAGAGLGRYAGVTPSPAYGASVFAAVAHGAQRFRIGVTATEEVATPMTAAAFRWTIGRAEVCPYTVSWSWLALAPCAGLEAGVLSGRGIDVGMADGGARPWVAPDGLLRLTVQLGRAALELDGIVAAPLVRDRYFIAPGTTVHEVPAVTTGATASIGFAL
jgi:hypothetical protein